MTLTLQHAAMMKRTLTIYSSMAKKYCVDRAYKSGPAKGKVFRPAREIPFTLEEFRTFVVAQVGGPKPCPWCRTMIDMENFVTDHVVPVQRGGSMGLENLQCICADCNSIKGDLTGEEYNALREALFKLGPATEKSVLKRLRMGAMGMRLRHFGKKSISAASVPNDPNW